MEKEISSCCVCYRPMHQRCIQNDSNVSKDNVRVIVKAIDPDGGELRKKQTGHGILMDMIN